VGSVHQQHQPAAAIQRTPRHSATVVAVRELTPRMRRITVAGPSLRGLRPRAAQDVELVLVDDTGRKVKRRYTIRHARPERGEFDLDALRHGGGSAPGAAWAAAARPGDAVEFFGPRGRMEHSDADWHLFVGDESAVPAIAAMVETLPAEQCAIAVLEVGGPTDEMPLDRVDGAFTTHWVHRLGAEPGHPELLAAELAQLAPPPGTGHAYLLGESRAMIALRPALSDQEIAHGDVYVKGYWNRGRISARPAGRP
jgi:NADPH-dependent ferric siderophore reductase